MDDTFYRPPDRGKYLLEHEIEQLLDAANDLGEREWRFLRFMANTGVRPSEARQIKVSDIYPNENRINVHTIKQKANAKGKIPEYTRDVDIDQNFAEDISEWIKNKSSDDRLFEISRYTMWRIFKRAIKKARENGASLKDTYTLYSLRHSRAIYLLEWTKSDLIYVSRQLGHSSINVTKVYLHCLPSKREEYVKKCIKGF